MHLEVFRGCANCRRKLAITDFQVLSFPERLPALLDSLGFGYSNIRKQSVVQFKECFALSASLVAPDCERNPISERRHSRAA
jgi:hypothetical protein